MSESTFTYPNDATIYRLAAKRAIAHGALSLAAELEDEARKSDEIIAAWNRQRYGELPDPKPRKAGRK